MTLADIVKRSGLSRRQLAAKCGCSAGTIQNILNGKLPKNWSAISQNFILAMAPVATFKQISRAVSAAQTETIKAERAETKKEKEKTMILQKQSFSSEARQVFKIGRNPFAEPQKAEDVYICPENRYVFESLMDAAKHGNFMAIVGESGSGKSTLATKMEEKLKTDGEPVTIIKPYILGLSSSEKTGRPLKARDIAESIILTVQPGTGMPSSNEQLFRKVHQVLIEASENKRRHMVILEEAHELNAHTLKTLKRFWELSSGMRRLLSIVLIGQTELEEKLSSTAKDVREVVQRCDVIKLPNIPNVSEYLAFLFSRAKMNLADVFEPEALDVLQEKLLVSQDLHGQGTNMAYPLAIANFATRAMNQAAKFGETKVTAEVMRELHFA